MNNHKAELKMSLQELRSAINVYKNTWINKYSTNCYAYALGLDIPQYEITDYAYAPGVIANSKIFLPSQQFFTYKHLINNIYLDLKALDIEFREISPSEKIKPNEWKIALFTTNTYHNKISDYHFLRQHNNGIWYHKNGFFEPVSNYDDHAQIITNPEECFLKYRTYNKCLSLKLK